eukprot:scaffold19271_cov28-Tisochrysis_lutea.AAC.13
MGALPVSASVIESAIEPRVSSLRTATRTNSTRPSWRLRSLKRSSALPASGARAKLDTGTPPDHSAPRFSRLSCRSLGAIASCQYNTSKASAVAAGGRTPAPSSLQPACRYSSEDEVRLRMMNRGERVSSSDDPMRWGT